MLGVSHIQCARCQAEVGTREDDVYLRLGSLRTGPLVGSPVRAEERKGRQGLLALLKQSHLYVPRSSSYHLVLIHTLAVPYLLNFG